MNDVVAGVMFYATRLYVQAAQKNGGGDEKQPAMTALVLLNTRLVTGYQSVAEMTRGRSKSPWGNHFAFLHVSVPSCGADASAADPVSFVLEAKRTIKAKRASLAVFLTGHLLEALRKLRGAEVRAHATYLVRLFIRTS